MTTETPVTTFTPKTPDTPENQPVTNQPKSAFKIIRQNTSLGLMPRPEINISCAPGLEYLSQVDQISIFQKTVAVENGLEGPTKFVLKSLDGKQIYTANEDSVLWKREIYLSTRPMQLKIISNSDKEIIVLNRPLNFCTCCFQNVEVMAPVGKVIGFVHQEKSCVQEKYTIKNAAGDVMFRLMGPPKTCCNTEIPKLTILTRNGQVKVATISKLRCEPSLDTSLKADKIMLKFCADVDVTSKALILAATFLMVK
ncbi:phospholipid scramblase 1-like isoform X3 [Leptotrombidium deliense]|uniref:Phospholipid scramblase n=1 Tax=Leptotrombidium deliense TaxID=299467 RepID=A0A443S6V4_9ACAR|nr:phospholipid scramblase 1-like isoform X3 [Leptotrombidium deliense]